MFENLTSFTALFSSSEKLSIKIEAFNVLVNEVSNELEIVQFAQMRGLANRLERLLNVTITMKNASSDSEEQWLIDWKSFVTKLE